MSEPRNIVVTGCKGCPFAHYWHSEYGSDGRDCRIHDDEPVDAYANAPDVSPEWCPLRAAPMTVHLAVRQ